MTARSTFLIAGTVTAAILTTMIVALAARASTDFHDEPDPAYVGLNCSSADTVERRLTASGASVTRMAGGDLTRFISDFWQEFGSGPAPEADAVLIWWREHHEQGRR